MYGTDAIPDFIRNDETFRMLSYKDMFIETTRGRAISTISTTIFFCIKILFVFYLIIKKNNYNLIFILQRELDISK